MVTMSTFESCIMSLPSSYPALAPKALAASSAFAWLPEATATSSRPERCWTAGTWASFAHPRSALAPMIPTPSVVAMSLLLIFFDSNVARDLSRPRSLTKHGIRGFEHDGVCPATQHHKDDDSIALPVAGRS